MEKEIKIMEEKAMVTKEIAKLDSQQLVELSSTIQPLGSSKLYLVGELLIDYAFQKKLEDELIPQRPEYNSVEREIEVIFGRITKKIKDMSEKDVKRLHEKIKQLKEKEGKKDEGTKGLIRV
jgi:hypothetical protein